MIVIDEDDDVTWGIHHIFAYSYVKRITLSAPLLLSI